VPCGLFFYPPDAASGGTQKSPRDIPEGSESPEIISRRRLPRRGRERDRWRPLLAKRDHRREPYNLQRLLHRGAYARPEDRAVILSPELRRLDCWKRALFGFDEHFTRGDRLIAVGVFAWSALQFVLFAGAILRNLVHPWPDRCWAVYFWYTGVLLVLVMGVVTSVWLAAGGIMDLRKMFQRLATLERNTSDDGRVIGQANVEDADPVIARKPRRVACQPRACKVRVSLSVEPTLVDRPW
jgi:hypothetical protein